MLPGPSRGLEHAILVGWELNGVAIVQSGSALTIALTNATNVFGISEDRAQLTGTCTKNQLLTGGPTGTRLTDYFNKSCFTTPPIIGADGKGAAFGNSGTGIVDGPGQANVDLSISKTARLSLAMTAPVFNFVPISSTPSTILSSPILIQIFLLLPSE